MTSFLTDGPEDGRTLVLAHGAGAPMDHPWMDAIVERLASRGLRVVRFEFAYMSGRRAPGGSRRGPSPAATLVREWHDAIAALGDPGELVIGGKSMGGRVASMVADDAGVRGVVALGYPFHPPGKPTSLRTAHLVALRTPMLVAQGERDTFGSRDEVAGYELSPAIEFCWLPDGDHSLKPRKASGKTLDGNLESAADAVAAFVARL